MNEKLVKKYMRLAKQVGTDNNPCHSRQIGALIVSDDGQKVLGVGYNGPPKGVPHNETREYLSDCFWPQLDAYEKSLIKYKLYGAADFILDDAKVKEDFLNQFEGCKTCPRRHVNASSGKRLELCSCVHAETNAIVNSADNLKGAVIIAYCGVPCVECTKLIINSQIKQVYVLEVKPDYSHNSRWLFDKAGVELIEHPEEWYMEK